jgi:nucleotide-binding universal stress UspA family protein
LIRKILVPLDGSELAGKALDLALDQAQKYSAEIVLLSVVPPLMIPTTLEPTIGGAIVSPGIILGIEEAAEVYHKRVLSEALKRSKKSKPRVKVSSKLAKGNVADRILETAKEGEFDMIIMGSHGLSGFKKFLLGSVSNQVVHKSPCPVLIVK